ncbi:MAG: His/Gly/Thr/Pro-type tRNA ligase C-terminal domain-containing protein, partial [Candidatus Thalassarchaeaceae archaeon]|nr:His/Gly/Thr/Pro-type tRNA ligase C-terminal domain-containing protein [Candidatus Thalassarchaeaceae archaeon]
KRAREEGVDPSELRIEEDEAGFKKEVYWVRNAGENDLDVPMFLRPTSETAMYTMFPLWVRSHADLPLKTYQIVNTFRYETKQTRSFIRVREIHFFEAHTAHIDEDCATRQIEEDLEIVGRLMERMALPVIISKRPVWDTFPGAWYTIAIDVVMPNGRTLQVASVHHYKDQWAKAFDLTYADSDGESHYCHQTTYGMSERLLGAVVGIHGDDSGLIFPPDVAPIQVIIMPVASHKSPDVDSTVSDVVNKLRDSGIRCKVDNRDLRPGQKYYDWEIKGVPLRLEIGPRDVESGNAFAARRTGGKEPIPLAEISVQVKSQLQIVQDELTVRSKVHFSNSVIELDNLQTPIEEGKIYSVAFDGNDADAELLEKTTGLAILGDSIDEYQEDRPCIITGNLTRRCQHLARMY